MLSKGVKIVSKQAITKMHAVIIIAILVVGIGAVSAGYYWLSRPASATGNIVVGVSLSFTGSGAAGGTDIKHGLDMWVKEVNDKGGLLGRNITLVAYDDGSDASQCISNYERLITIENVDLLIGPFTSGLALATGPIFEQYKFPCVNPDDGADVIHQKGWNYTFAVYPPVSRHAVNWINLMAGQTPKPQSIAIISESGTYALQLAVGARNGAHNNSLTIVDDEQFAPGITTFSSILQKIKSLNPDLLFGAGTLPEATLMTKEMKEADVNPKAFWFDTGPDQPQYITALGKDAEYVYTVDIWSSHLTQYPEAVAFAQAYKAKYGVEADYHPVGGYVAGKIVELAVTNAGSLDKEAIRSALLQIDTFVVGWGVKFTSDPTFSGANTKAPSIVAQIQNGTWALLGPPEYKQTDAWYPTPSWSQRP